MKTIRNLIVLAAAFLVGASLPCFAVPPPFPTGQKNVAPPVGLLGYPIGSYLTIEGVRAEQGKVGVHTLLVDTINGHKLDKPVGLWIENQELPQGERRVLKGYETGEWIGTPDEVLRATGGPAPQAKWQFGFLFVVIGDEQPAAKDKTEPSPIKSSPLPGGNKPLTVEEAAQTGAETAAKDIQAGVFRILYYGKPYSADKPLVDDATRFRVQVIGGCEVTPPFVAEVKAYNDAMRQWQAKHPQNIAKPVSAKPLDVGYGTLEIPDDFDFTKTGTKDSFRGTLTRKSDGFTLYLDIGGMAGTHMHEGMKDKCTYFRKHSIGGLPAITGIETIPDGKRIVTTVAYEPKTDREPANFWVAIHKDTDIADFLIIVASYQPKAK